MTEQQRKAMEMALKFIVVSSAKDKAWYTTEEFELVSALREALAQPEQEPVAWQDPQYKTLIEPHKAHPDWIPLYTEPPKREWVGLTRRELDIATLGLEDLSDCYKAIEAKLKEKNT